MTSTALIPADVRSELAGESTSAASFLADLETLLVETPDDLEYASGILLEVKNQWKRLEERRKKITVPIDTAKKEVQDLFRPPQKALEAAESLLKEKIGAYQIARNAERAALLPAVASGDAPPTALAPVEHVKGVSVTESWTWEVEDLDAVPRQCMNVDPAKVQYVIDHCDGEPVIPGIRFIRKGNVRVRT